jgi:hypothetical protein
VPLELYISSLLPLLSFREPLKLTLYRLAVDVLVIVMFASVFIVALTVCIVRLATFISLIKDVLFATRAWFAVTYTYCLTVRGPS